MANGRPALTASCGRRSALAAIAEYKAEHGVITEEEMAAIDWNRPPEDAT